MRRRPPGENEIFRPLSAADPRTPGRLRACLMALVMVGVSGLVVSCGSMAEPSHSASTGSTAMAMDGATAAAWAARPAYTDVSTRTTEAYAYALQHQAMLSYLPCYCGCGAMGHGSNLDCYYEPRSDGAISFEEHASYCDICVDITLRAQQLARSGTALASIRSAIDAEFGNAGPGTDTPLPAS
jgi:Protein of unknown function with PCYCGC motif